MDKLGHGVMVKVQALTLQLLNNHNKHKLSNQLNKLHHKLNKHNNHNKKQLQKLQLNHQAQMKLQVVLQ